MRSTILLLMVASASLAGETDVDKARSAAAIFEANRAKFSVWTIEFNYTVVYAKTLDDALAKRWINPSVAHGVCTFDGANGRYEVAHDLKDLAEKRVEVEPGRFQTHLISRRYLTDGEVTMFDNMSPNPQGTAMRHVVQINPGTDLFRRSVHLPLGLGQGDLGKRGSLDDQVRMVQKQTGRRLAVQDGVKLRGMDVVEFVFTGPDDKSINLSYWVDLEHGAMPVQTFVESPTPAGVSKSYTILDDLRDAGNGRWFPYRKLAYYERSNLVHEWMITKADFTVPRDPSSFQLKFDKPVKVADNVRRVVYPAGTTWDLARLPKAERTWGVSRSSAGGSRRKDFAPTPYIPSPVMPGERPAESKGWIIAVIVVGVILLAVAARLYLKRGNDG